MLARQPKINCNSYRTLQSRNGYPERRRQIGYGLAPYEAISIGILINDELAQSIKVKHLWQQMPIKDIEPGLDVFEGVVQPPGVNSPPDLPDALNR